MRLQVLKYFLLVCMVLQISLPVASRADDERYSSLVIDASTGAVLHQENAGKLRYPASLTKMMTLYLAFQALDSGTIKMNTRFQVSMHAATQKPSLIGFRNGQTVAVQDLINAVIIKSANDAAVVLAEGLAGSEWQFAILMTRTAKNLGMKHTNFANASGLPDERQVTTAYDLARLAVALRRDYPQFYPMFSRSSFTYSGRTYFTHNRVTKNYRGADGLKTGYIRASGFNLVTSAKRGDKSLVGVVMGGRSIKSRDTTMVKLLDEAFYKMASGGAEGSPILNTSATKDETPSKQSNSDDSKLVDASKQIAYIPAGEINKKIIAQKIKPSNATNQSAVFSREVAVVADSNIVYKEPGKDLLRLAGRGASDKNSASGISNVPVSSPDNLRPARIVAKEAFAPTPRLRPGVNEKAVAKLSAKDALSLADVQQ